MVEFLKKATEWVLQKEQEAAEQCRIDLKDLDRQIAYVEAKRDALKKEYEENISELEHILNRLHAIKASELKCRNSA